MSEIKICGICQREIKLDSDNYVHIRDYYKGKFSTEGYYHTQCYNDKLKGGEDLKTMKKEAFGLLSKAKQIINRAGGGEEVIQIN